MRIMLGLVFFTILASNVYADISEVLLPKYPPKVVVRNQKGDLLTAISSPLLKYRDMKLFVRRDKNSSTGYYAPDNVCEAAKTLLSMLPKDYANSLLENYEEFFEYGVIFSDPDVDERLSDLIIFLDEIWDLKNHENPISLQLASHDAEEIFLKLLTIVKGVSNSNYGNKKIDQCG